MLVLYRVADRQYKFYPQVCARGLMGGIAMQWHGPDPRGASVLNTCVRNFASDVHPLGLILQQRKSGVVATTTRAAKCLHGGIKSTRLKGNKTSSESRSRSPWSRVSRVQEGARMKTNPCCQKG
eukprot:4231958-Pyramimonas_sp.AAC.1